MDAEEALTIAEDIEKTGKVKSLEIIDVNGSSWTIKQLRKNLQSIESTPHDVELFFDGNYDLNSKLAGVGAVIYYKLNNERFRLRKNASFEYIESNNEAEYAALYFAVTECINLGIKQQNIRIFGDSQTVIHPMSGEWPLYEKELSNWADRIDEMLANAQLIPQYEHIPRSENSEANSLAEQALNGTSIEAIKKVD